MLDETGRRIAALLAKKLREGIVWPGDPEKNLPEKTIDLLAFRPQPGMPEEVNDLIAVSVKQISEAIVHTIQGEAETDLVPRGEHTRLETLERRTSGEQQFELPVPVHCRCDTALKDPLAYLTITDNARIVIDGEALLRGLAKREIRHPHKRIEKKK